MLSKDKLMTVIKMRIEESENTGDIAGGSGHLSNVSYVIDKVSDPVKSDDGWQITITYTKIIETEFTYYPDNPPYEVKILKTLIFDNNDNIINVIDEKTETINSGMNFDL